MTASGWLATYPYAGGGRFCYQRIVDQLQVRCPVPVHMPVLAGREGRFRDEACRTVEDMVEDLFSQLEGEARERGLSWQDLVLFGYSMGATLAVLVAARIEKDRGTAVRAVVVGGAPAPHRASSRLGELTDLSLIDHLGDVGFVPPEILDNQEILALFLPALRADYDVVASVPAIPVTLDAPVVVIAGTEDALIGDPEMASWENISRSGIKFIHTTGDHASALASVDIWSSVLAHQLEQPRNNGSGTEI